MAKAFEVGFIFNAKKATGFDKTFKGISGSISSITKTIAGVAGAYIGIQTIKDAVVVYSEYEKTMSGVKAVSGASAEDMKKLNDEALKLKNASPKEAAEAFDSLTAAGLNVNETIAALPNVINVAKAGNLDLATATDLATGAMATLGYQAGDMGTFVDKAGKPVDAMTHFLDKATKAGAASNASTQNLLETYSAVGGQFKAFNTGLDESGALIGLLANRGTVGVEAGTSLNTLIQRVTDSSGPAAKAFKKLGISVYDSSGNFKGLEAVFMETGEAMKGLSEEEQAYYRGTIAGKGAGASKAFSDILAGMGDEYHNLKASIGDSDGAMQGMADTMDDNLIGAWNRVKIAADQTKIKIIGAFSKPMQGLILKFVDILPVIADKAMAAVDFVAGKIEEYGPTIGGFFSGIGEGIKGVYDKAKPALNWIGEVGLPKIVEFAGKVFEKAKQVYDFLKNNWETIGPIITGIVIAWGAFTVALIVIKGIIIAVTAVGAALNFVMNANPIGLIVTAIGLLIGVGILLYKNWDTIKTKASELWGSLKNGFATFITGFTSKFPLLGNGLQAAITNIGNIFEGIKTIFTGIITFVKGVFTGDWAQAWEGVKTIFSGIFETFIAIAKAPINGIIGLINGVIGGINNIKFPDWVPGIGGKGINIPQIPLLAQGGIVTKPTMAMVGEGNESEAVLPLSKLQGLLDFKEGPIAGLLERFASRDVSSSSQNSIVFSPQIIIEGGGNSKNQIEELMPKLFAMFKKFMDQYLKDKKRKGLD